MPKAQGLGCPPRPLSGPVGWRLNMADLSRRGLGGRGFLPLLSALLLALTALPAFADLAVKVEYGWSDSYRAGRWTPIFITTSDPGLQLARNVIIEVAGPHDQSHGLRILTG